MQACRWVSYIYRYRETKRQENAGFIKIQKLKYESGDIGRFQIGIRIMKLMPCRCEVYLMLEPDRIYPVQTMYISERMRDMIMLRFDLPWTIAVSGEKSISECIGLFFRCEDGDIFAGMWKEGRLCVNPIVISETEQKTKDNERDIHKDKDINQGKEKDEKKNLSLQQPCKPRKREPENTYREMLNTYPKLPLFADTHLLECVKIAPQDIGKLAIGNWKLGTNSFVSHGFYHYQYLMFGRVLLDGEERIVVGIPGVFTNKERYVANMFGFIRFVPSQKTDYLTGKFGYWVVEVVSE